MTEKKLEIEFDTQPFFADFGGDKKQDILYSDPAGNIKVAVQQSNGHYDLTIEDFTTSVALSNAEVDYCMDPNSDSKLSIPHSSTFIDLDGDCMPDIFLTRASGNSYTFEIYI